MATDVLQQLESFKKNDHYTIISLSKSVNPDEVTTPDKRGSGASSGDFTGATPRELAADLESYQVHPDIRGGVYIVCLSTCIGTILKVTTVLYRTSDQRKVPSRARMFSAQFRRCAGERPP